MKIPLGAEKKAHLQSQLSYSAISHNAQTFHLILILMFHLWGRIKYNSLWYANGGVTMVVKICENCSQNDIR